MGWHYSQCSIHVHVPTYVSIHVLVKQVYLMTEKWTLTYTHNVLHTLLPIQIRDEAVSAGLVPNRESCWVYFVQKCSVNLHIVLCMSPVGETLKNRCRNFPGLVNNVSIDWFTPWPKQALQAVATHFLAEVH